ncbi:hypothetical protein D3C72_986300 [compost metagenome]
MNELNTFHAGRVLERCLPLLYIFNKIITCHAERFVRQVPENRPFILAIDGNRRNPALLQCLRNLHELIERLRRLKAQILKHLDVVPEYLDSVFKRESIHAAVCELLILQGHRAEIFIFSKFLQ